MDEYTPPDPNHRRAGSDPDPQAPQQLSASAPDQPQQPPWYGYPPPAHNVGSEGNLPPAASPPAGAGTQPIGTPAYPGGTTWGSAPAAGWPGDPSDPAAPSPTARKAAPWKKVAGGIALAAVIAGGGVAAVSAANAASSSASTQTAPGGFGANGNGMAANGYGPAAGGSATGMPGGRGGVSVLNSALHGEFVVPTQDGGTQTQRLQNGEVTALSAESLLVTSSDGFTATYVLPAGLDVSQIAVGDTVRVIATVNGDTVTATAVQSGTAGNQGGQGQGGQIQGGGGMPGGAGVPDGAAPTGAPVAPQTS